MNYESWSGTIPIPISFSTDYEDTYEPNATNKITYCTAHIILLGYAEKRR